MKFYYYAILSITYLWGVVVAHRDASMRSLQSVPPEAGEFSVVIQGESNFAPGKFCNVNGGKDNLAGADNNYAVSGGGFSNFAGSTFSTISGGTENGIASFAQKHCTISGGDSNLIDTVFTSSVITGGQTNKMDFGPEIRKGCTISGGENINCSTEYGVATGGAFNAAKNVAAVAFGGLGNFVFGQSATSVGGEGNSINGDISIGLGLRTIVDNDSSMVIFLNPGDFIDDFFGPESDTDVDGQFIVNAESYSFQIGKNRDDLRFQITEDNIQNLIDALENAV